MLKIATKFRPERAAFERACGAGFRYVELWLDAAVLAALQQWLPLAHQYGLVCVPHFPNCLEQSSATLMHAASLFRAHDCDCMVIHQPQADRYGEDLLRLEPSIKLAVENHDLSETDFDHWAYRNGGLALDVEHLWKYTLRDAPLRDLLARLHDFLSRYCHKLLHVHLPGYWPGSPEHRPMVCGSEMIFPVLSMLAEFRFDGFVVSEVDLEFQTAEDLRMDLQLFNVWRERHGVFLGQVNRAG